MTSAPALQIPNGGADFELVQREIADPGRRDVRIRVEACGVCHSDVMAKSGMAASYPRIPGHEIAGVVDAVGADVTASIVVTAASGWVLVPG